MSETVSFVIALLVAAILGNLMAKGGLYYIIVLVLLLILFFITGILVPSLRIPVVILAGTALLLILIELFKYLKKKKALEGEKL